MALGANLGAPATTLRAVLPHLDLLGTIEARSRLFRTAPVGGPPGQPDYLNAVIALRPRPELGEPEALLAALLAIEVRFGRERHERWEARTLDLDLLAIGGLVRREPDPILPHPRMMERPFVLAPLLDVAPEWRHPVSGRRADAALRALPSGGVAPSGERWEPR